MRPPPLPHFEYLPGLRGRSGAAERCRTPHNDCDDSVGSDRPPAAPTVQSLQGGVLARASQVLLRVRVLVTGQRCAWLIGVFHGVPHLGRELLPDACLPSRGERLIPRLEYALHFLLGFVTLLPVLVAFVEGTSSDTRSREKRPEYIAIYEELQITFVALLKPLGIDVLGVLAPLPLCLLTGRLNG